MLDDWWLAQPSITAKSAWITFRDHADPTLRAEMQVAAAKVALAVMADPAPWLTAGVPVP
eukprot:11216022-Alexandrium_andersonii.AAC.1